LENLAFSPANGARQETISPKPTSVNTVVSEMAEVAASLKRALTIHLRSAVLLLLLRLALQ